MITIAFCAEVEANFPSYCCAWTIFSPSVILSCFKIQCRIATSSLSGGEGQLTLKPCNENIKSPSVQKAWGESPGPCRLLGRWSGPRRAPHRRAARGVPRSADSPPPLCTPRRMCCTAASCLHREKTYFRPSIGNNCMWAQKN